MTRIVITGASGRLGSTLATGLTRSDRTLTLADKVRPASPDSSGEFVQIDLTDLDDVIELCRGVDTVVHTAGIPDEAPFDDLLDANIRTTYNVFEAARICKVRRVIYASSAHVVGLYPRGQDLDENVAFAPDTVYGATKVFGESLGTLYSAKHGLEVISLRIGSFRARPEDPRQLFTWLSPGDAVSLFDRCIDADISGHVVLYGISNNTHRWWHDAGSELIGYRPTDDAEPFSHRVRPKDSGLLWQGGVFAEPGYLGGAG
jgi:uronate dehydrogenase